MNQLPNFFSFSPSEISDRDDLRSDFMRSLLVRSKATRFSFDKEIQIPRTIIQFWDNPHAIPADVQSCMKTWDSLEMSGFTHVCFNDYSARKVISQNFSSRYVQAFDSCRHPAMRADYFRLCYMLLYGGIYIDADDEYQGVDMNRYACTDKLLLQAMCYDNVSASMTDINVALQDVSDDGKIFYVNNNPLIAPSGHPIISLALERATTKLNNNDDYKIHDIQSLTGPGNLTASLVYHASKLARNHTSNDFGLLTNWDRIALSRWPLSYRNDERNWRKWSFAKDNLAGRGGAGR